MTGRRKRISGRKGMSTLQVACQSANQGRASVAERGFALLLSALVTLQPALVYGNDIRPVDGATTLDQSANGTTVVNIATPSASGLSHNRYGAFDVSQDGVILNNSRKVVRTDIG